MSGQSCNCAGEVAALQSRLGWLEQRIQSIEAEMANVAEAIREVGDHLGRRIESTNDHLKLVQAGVAGVGAALIAVKASTEKGFAATQELQERQTSAMVQLDSVKAYTEAVALSRKVASFREEVEDRFNKAVEGVVLNRILYDKHFGALHEEHAEKLRTIGSHIYGIWEEDFSRLEKTAQVPTSAYAQVSFEVDLHRLASRSAQLDQDLEMVRARHLETLAGLEDAFERTMSERYALDGVEEGDTVCVPAVVTLGADEAELIVDRRAVAPPQGAGGGAALEPAGRAPLVAAYCATAEAKARVRQDCRTRPMTDDEKEALSIAIGRLACRGLVDPQLVPGFVKYLAGVQMNIVDGAFPERAVDVAGVR